MARSHILTASRAWTLAAALFLSATEMGSAQSLFAESGIPQSRRNYDVLHYRLRLSFDEEKKQVFGTSDITLTPLGAGIDSVLLDAVHMDIREVLSGDSTTLRRRSTDSTLTIYLANTIGPADTVSVSVAYTCTPQRGMYFIRPDSADLTRRWQIWTQGQETENRHWFPCYDAPDDKATSEVIATVREEYTLLSNGALIATAHDSARHTRTFHWKQSNPHSSYLIMLAAGEYAVLSDSAGSIPLLHYVYPEDLRHAPRSFSTTPVIMEFLENLTGYPYPWEKYSHIIVDQFMWGGMENTSAVTLNELYIYDERAALDGSAVDVVAHELAHQWVGDLVTCRDWTHLWLNEGFATYMEMLYKRHNLGENEFQMELTSSSHAVRQAERSLGRKPLVSHESYGVNLYQKGAWVLRMLSRVLGEERFLTALQIYLKENEFRSIGTEDFISSVEKSTGEDLGWFFNQWVYGTGHPELTVGTLWDESGKRLTVTVRQTQQKDSLTGTFRFPLDIETTTSSGHNLNRVWVEGDEERFVIPLDDRPSMVIVDKGTHLLKTVNFQKTKEELIYQLRHAGVVGDRLDALEGLRTYDGNREVFHAVKWTAFNDPFRVPRERAVRFLEEAKDTASPQIFFELAADPSPAVRSAAISALRRYRTVDAASFVQETAETDSSYYVVATCLRVLTVVDSGRAFALAARLVDTDSYQDMVRRASFNAMRDLKDVRAIPFATRYVGPETHPSTRIAALGVLREVGRNDDHTRSLMQTLVANPNPSVRSSSIRTLGSWGKEFQGLLRDRKAVEQDDEVLRILNEMLD